MNRNLVRLMTGPAKLVTIVIIMSSVLLEDVLAVHFQVAFVQSVYLMMTVKVTVIHSRELFQRHFVTRQMVVTEFVLSGKMAIPLMTMDTLCGLAQKMIHL